MKERYRIVIENDWHWMASSFTLTGAIEAAVSLASWFRSRAWIIKTNQPGGKVVTVYDWFGREANQG